MDGMQIAFNAVCIIWMDHLHFLHSDDIIGSSEQNGRLLNKSEVRKAGDRSNWLHLKFDSFGLSVLFSYFEESSI